MAADRVVMTRVARSSTSELAESPIVALVWSTIALIACAASMLHGTWWFAAPAGCFAVLGFWVALRLRKRKALLADFLGNLRELESISVTEQTLLPEHCIYCDQSTTRFVPVTEQSESAANVMTRAVAGVEMVKTLTVYIPVCHRCKLLDPQPSAIDFEEGYMCFYVHPKFMAHLEGEVSHNEENGE